MSSPECGTDCLCLHLVGKPHCEDGYRKEVFAREGKQGQTWVNTTPGLEGIWETASVVSVKGPSRVGPQCFFLFFLLAKLTESANMRLNKYKNNSKLLIS